MLLLADFNSALVAQSVEHLHGKEGVIGSNPIEGWVITDYENYCFYISSVDMRSVFVIICESFDFYTVVDVWILINRGNRGNRGIDWYGK